MIIYKLTCPNQKSYIGLTVDFDRRLKEHILSSTPIGKALREHGVENFEISILIESDNPGLIKLKEKEYIDSFNTVSNGYNRRSGGGGKNAGCALPPLRESLHIRKPSSICVGGRSLPKSIG